MQKINWLDPCCGGDNKNEASYLSVINKFFKPKNILGIDIRKDSKAHIIMNYLDFEKKNINIYDIIISNPPILFSRRFYKKIT